MAMRALTLNSPDCCENCRCGAYCDGCPDYTGIKARVMVSLPPQLGPLRSTRTGHSLGHTAFHHVGHDGLGDVPATNPYFSFVNQRRFPYNWAGGAGGVPHSRVAASSRGLGSADLVESGLEAGGPYVHWPAFAYTKLHDPRYVASGDWPLVRPAGMEPLGLSDNEKRLGMVLAAAGIGWLLWKHMGKAGKRGSRRLARKTRQLHARANPSNPAGYRYTVTASTKRRGKGRRRYGKIGFTTKAAATAYADDLRKGGHKARVRKA